MTYRVAVVQNEGESVRSTYANVAKNLSKIPGLAGYQFETFDSHNIELLFAPGDRHISRFDSLFVSTNATHEAHTYNCLNANAADIEAFLNKGGGLFLSYQKRLSSSPDAPAYIPFLGSHYRVALIERPSAEPDSGQGEIDYAVREKCFESAAGQLILNYPKTITKESITHHCKFNDFKRHFYRAHLAFEFSWKYEPLLVDCSYESPALRVLLATNRVSFAGERVVVSCIALDWELNVDLMANIVVYITEGIPRVAFVDAGSKRNGDFEYVVASARLAKIAHAVHRDPTAIPAYLKSVHQIYVFSPGWTDCQAETLWNEIAELDGPKHEAIRRPYRRLYQMASAGSGMAMKQWSSFSSVDLLIDRVVFEIESRFRGGFWERSFWNTHDALLMMIDTGVDVSAYLPGVLGDASAHVADGGYDDIVGSTVGLLTLLSSIESAYPGALQTHGFDSDRIASIVEWTARACSSQSLSGRQAASLALLQDARYRMVMASTQSDWAEEMRCELGRSISDSLNELDAQTPIDLCRLLSCALVAGSDEQTLIQIASQLGCLQQANGAWETTGRTAAVLIAILKSWSLMSASVRATADLENMVYKSVLYLRSEFDPETSSWHKHFQTTARAVHAIGLYNSIFRQSTQEFFEVIQSNLGRMNSALTLRAARTEFQALVEDNTGQKAKLAESNQNAARLAAENQYRRGLVSRLHKRLTYVQSALVIIGSLFASLLLSLAVNYPFVLTGVVSEVGSALPLVAGAIISLFFAWWVNPKRPT